ncbi:unnamed protein product [Closterium sp. NIES-65]|nr:unnamed protein product [Closterium sp. NIES-65]
MYVIIQVGSQAYAHRLFLYATSPTLKLFPPGAVAGAEELGPHTDHHGAALVLLRRCRLSPGELANLVDSTFLSRYIHRMYWCEHVESCPWQMVRSVAQWGETQAQAQAQAVGGMRGAAETGESGGAQKEEEGEEEESRAQVAEQGQGQKGEEKQEEQERGLEQEQQQQQEEKQQEQQQEEEKQQEQQQEEEKQQEQQQEEEKQQEQQQEEEGKVREQTQASPPPCVSIRVQAFPKHFERWIATHLPPSLPLDPKRFTHTLSAVSTAPHFFPFHPRQPSAPPSLTPFDLLPPPRRTRRDRTPLPLVPPDPRIFFSLSPARSMWRLASDRKAGSDGCASSAVSKLEEVLHVVGWRLRADMTAMDVGAAPGAWTEYLSARIRHVLAIDPAALSPAVTARGNVTHIKKMVEDAWDDVQAWSLACQADSSQPHPTGGDGCDTNRVHEPGTKTGAPTNTTSASVAASSSSSIATSSSGIGSCAGTAPLSAGSSEHGGGAAAAMCHGLFCDANKHPLQAATLVAPLLPALASGGILVVTMKCRGRGRDKELLTQQLTDALPVSFRYAECVWLMANSVFERTFVGIKA